ncbi:MAG TPA: isoprenylcysteine carboxylmethyltransferase family protein [Gaiellaceae bacterium]|nr:isoprenylcysteine carboxylmethyltransferase family protein [Gaiellaceae bacterium]
MQAPSLGARGQGWVWLQFPLMAAVLAAGFVPPDWPAAVEPAFDAAGTVLALAGGAAGLWAARALGRSLTPYPRPGERGELVERGPYRLVRHPVYAAGLVFFAGYSLWARPLALVLTAVLAVVWALKAAVEERFLRSRYPSYAAYAARVPNRLVPGVY